ncbi:MAG: IS256 family transposase [Gemmatimonadetes bacterium]|nr:IS256 family transposase [Gemmatimonadota bacterium]
MAEITKMEMGEILRKRLQEAGPDQLREMVQMFAEALMGAEADGLCGAAYGERSADRVNYRNGYRHRRWDTRVGSIALAIPKLRSGSYFPDWLLEPRRRSERALIAVVAECYVKGVSTRKVDKVIQQLGIEGIGKSQVSELAKSLDEQVSAFRTRPLEATAYPYVWLDALYVKCREDGRIANVAVVVATGVTDDGHREVLGVDVVTTENEAAWTGFLRSLVARGLSGVQLVVSDAHEGLKSAIGKVLHGASWQRCRTHFMRNLLCKVPKSAQRLVATLVRGIFEQPDADAVWRMYAEVVEKLEPKFGAAAKLLDQAGPDVLAFTAFPNEHWRRVWSNNPLERLNKELRRRSDVVGIFPNREAVIRLLGAVLCEQHDEWVVARRYLTIGSLDLLVRKTDEKTLDEEQTPLAMTA